MFKEQTDVVTEEQVGDYVDQLKRQGSKELDNFIIGEEDGMEIEGEESTTRTEDT